jgi:hypothetical protein
VADGGGVTVEKAGFGVIACEKADILEFPAEGHNVARLGVSSMRIAVVREPRQRRTVDKEDDYFWHWTLFQGSQHRYVWRSLIISTLPVGLY